MNVRHTVAVSEAEIIRAIQKYVASKTDGAGWEFDVNVRWRAKCAIVEARRPPIPTLTEAVHQEIEGHTA